MNIENHGPQNSRYRELGFTDTERDDVVAYSGLLDREEAMEFAAQLRDVARQLVTWAQSNDEGQLRLFDIAA